MGALGAYHHTALSSYGGYIPAESSFRLEFFNECVQRTHSNLSENTKDEVQWLKTLAPASRAFWFDVRGKDMERVLEGAFVQLPTDSGIQIQNFRHLVNLIDSLVKMPPQFRVYYDANGQPIHSPIGLPFFIIFDPLSNTPAGSRLFRVQEFNDILKKLFDAWGQYLRTPESTSCLHEGKHGWFSLAALESLEEHRGEFNSTYICPDPAAPNRGYTSWDAFFTRRFKPGMRPIPDPHDNTLIHSPCESTVYRKVAIIRLDEDIWLKGRKYTVPTMLDEDRSTSNFEGGVFYQAFLKPQDYHRWHSPVNGKVVKVVKIPGAYYVALPEGGVEQLPTPGSGDQPSFRTTMVSTRLLIYIQAHNQSIGLVCFVAIGLAEVSSCLAIVEEGDEVHAGQELGSFHFGGSCCALLFQRETKIRWIDCPVGKHIRLSSVIGRVLPS